MKTIRFGTFETNSSSAHVATICGQKKLEEYKAHKVICVFDRKGFGRFHPLGWNSKKPKVFNFQATN